jgi:hypothetical protein
MRWCQHGRWSNGPTNARVMSNGPPFATGCKPSGPSLPRTERLRGWRRARVFNAGAGRLGAARRTSREPRNSGPCGRLSGGALSRCSPASRGVSGDVAPRSIHAVEHSILSEASAARVRYSLSRHGTRAEGLVRRADPVRLRAVQSFGRSTFLYRKTIACSWSPSRPPASNRGPLDPPAEASPSGRLGVAGLQRNCRARKRV